MRKSWGKSNSSWAVGGGRFFEEILCRKPMSSWEEIVAEELQGNACGEIVRKTMKGSWVKGDWVQLEDYRWKQLGETPEKQPGVDVRYSEQLREKMEF